MTQVTKRVRLAVAVAAVVALVAVPVALAARQDTGPRARVAAPPAGATAEEVVRAYVAALDARDVETARSLVTPHHAAQVERSEDSWYRNVVSITDLRVRPPVAQTGRGSQAEGYREVVFVPVTFDLRQRKQQSLPDGETPWGYLLARNAPSERWVIVDEGPV